MKKLALLTCLLATSAYAGDLPTKAPPSAGFTDCTTLQCTGPYAGMNVTGTATNANVLANGINGSVMAGGQSLGVQAGYQFWNNTWFFGPEVFGDYTYGGSPVIVGTAPPKYLFGEIVKFGTPLSTFFGGITPASSTGLPAVLTANTISPYLFVGAAQRSWGTGVASGGGITFALDKIHWFLDARYTNIQYTANQQVNAQTSVPQENLISVGVNYKF